MNYTNKYGVHIHLDITGVSLTYYIGGGDYTSIYFETLAECKTKLAIAELNGVTGPHIISHSLKI